jgi:hypothetical protein
MRDIFCFAVLGLLTACGGGDASTSSAQQTGRDGMQRAMAVNAPAHTLVVRAKAQLAGTKTALPTRHKAH